MPASTTETLASPAPPVWLDRAHYPFASHWFQTPEGPLHYLDEGQGPVLLFVHGTPTWSFLWRNLILDLRGSFRCIAVDHLGFGLSGRPVVADPDSVYHPRAHALRLQALVRHLDLRNVTLVVHDFGGPIGLAGLLAEPARYRQAVLFNTWLWDNRDDPAARRLAGLIRSPLGSALYRWGNASPRWLLPMGFADKAKLTPEVHRHYLAPFPRGQRQAPLALGRALLDPWFADLGSQAQELRRLPVQLIWGLKDPAFGPKALARWQALLPQSRLLPLPQVGHFPQEEAPLAVAESVRPFLMESTAA